MFGIDLFAGPGGMSLGAQLSGITVQVAVEIDRRAASTYSCNHPATQLIVSDVASLSPDRIRDLCPTDCQLVLFGGPPCQGFSYSNSRHRRITNPLNWLFTEFLRFVSALSPQWVVFENVRGLMDTAKGYFLRRILAGFHDLGYDVCHGLLNAADFGVPQDRCRYFIVATTLDIDYGLPKPSGSGRVTVRDAIGDLPTLPNGNSACLMPYGDCAPSAYARRMRTRRRMCTNNLVSKNSELVVARYREIPQGRNWQSIPPYLMTNYRDPSRCHTGLYHRLREDLPSVVVGNFRKNMLIHPTEHRGLSIREAARLQSFPDSYRFLDSIGFQQQQVGNAVPPLLAKAVFDSITSRS